MMQDVANTGPPTDREERPRRFARVHRTGRCTRKWKKKKCVPGGRTNKRTSPPRRSQAGKREEPNRCSVTRKDTIRGIQHPGLEQPRPAHKHHTPNRHDPQSTSPAHAQGPQGTDGPSHLVPPPLLVAPLPSSQYPRCTVTGVEPTRLGTPPTPQRPVAACTPKPPSPRLPHPPGSAPMTTTGPKRSIAPAHAAPLRPGGTRLLRQLHLARQLAELGHVGARHAALREGLPVRRPSRVLDNNPRCRA